MRHKFFIREAPQSLIWRPGKWQTDSQHIFAYNLHDLWSQPKGGQIYWTVDCFKDSLLFSSLWVTTIGYIPIGLLAVYMYLVTKSLPLCFCILQEIKIWSQEWAWKTQPVGELLKQISMSIPDLHSVSSQSQQREEKEGWQWRHHRRENATAIARATFISTCVLWEFTEFISTHVLWGFTEFISTRVLWEFTKLANCSSGYVECIPRTVQFLIQNQICWICDSHWETNCYTFSLVYKTTTISTTLSHLMNIMQAQNRKLTDCGGQCEGNCFLKSSTSQSCFIMSDHLTSVCFSWISENKNAPIV